MVSRQSRAPSSSPSSTPSLRPPSAPATQGGSTVGTVFLILFLDLVCAGLVFPLLPYMMSELDATPTTVALLNGAYSVAQLFSSPVLGRLSDRHGRKPVLQLCLTGALVGYAILAVTPSLKALLAARVISGAMGGTSTIAQACISDLTSEEERAKKLGLVGLAFGLSFVIGPALGGILISKFDSRMPARLCCLVLIVNLIYTTFKFENPKRRGGPSKEKKITLWQALQSSQLQLLFLTKFLFGLCHYIVRSALPFFAKDHLNLPAQSTGYVFSLLGVLVGYVQGSLLSRLLNTYSEYTLLRVAAVLMGITCYVWSHVSEMYGLCALMFPLAVSVGFYHTTTQSLFTKSVSSEEVGSTLGLAGSVDSLVKILGPYGAAVLFEDYGPDAPGNFCAMLCVVLSVIWVSRSVETPVPKQNRKKL
eukprot:Rmarinus@m.16438